MNNNEENKELNNLNNSASFGVNSFVEENPDSSQAITNETNNESMMATEVLDDLPLNTTAQETLESTPTPVQPQMVSEPETPVVSSDTISEVPTPQGDPNQIEVKTSSTVKSEVGVSVLASVSGDTVTPTNNPLPTPIDVNAKPKKEAQDGKKQVKIVTKRDRAKQIVGVIFAILVIAAAAGCVYYFGFYANPKNYQIKSVTVELGEEVPTTASSYVTSPSKVNEADYVVDTTKVDNTKIGTYPYSINHKGATKSANVIVRDTKAPTLELKENLSFNKGETIALEDIVKECVDKSECTYDFDSPVDSSKSGEQEVSIKVSDNQNNTDVVKVKINIVDVANTVTCTSAAIKSEDGTYQTTKQDVLSIDSANNLVAVKSSEVVSYIDYSEYFKKRNENTSNSDYVFDNVTFSYSKAIEQSEVITSIEGNLDSAKVLYQEKGYTCK